MFPPSLINPDQPPEQKPRHRRSTQKKNHINPNQNLDTATTTAARSTFPPLLINPDQRFLHCDV